MPKSYTRPVAIIVGQGDCYEQTVATSSEKLRRTLSVGVRNNQADAFISNCKIFLDHRGKDDNLKTILLADTFHLPPKVEQYIEVAAYNEAIQTGAKADNYIFLFMAHQGFFSYEDFLSIDKTHIITLKVETSGSIVAKTDCRLWVDKKSGKLCIENVTKDDDFEQRTIVHDESVLRRNKNLPVSFTLWENKIQRDNCLRADFKVALEEVTNKKIKGEKIEGRPTDAAAEIVFEKYKNELAKPTQGGKSIKTPGGVRRICLAS